MTFLSNKKTYWIAAVVLSVTIAGLVLTRTRDVSGSDTSWQQVDRQLGRQPVFQDDIEEVPLILKSNGFQPKEVKLQSKRFLLSLDNRTDAKELRLRLMRANGSQVRELRVPREAGDWSELFDLPADTYTLTEAGHSNWACKIILQ